ncbi:MAG: putative manganese transporter [Saprospiraceae bacterium]
MDLLKIILVSLKESLTITGIVFVIMLILEFVNVFTNGVWKKYFTGKKWQQYIFAAILGMMPGCLGSYTIVALFSHNLVSVGALMATMVATSGDESFVMLAKFPVQALILFSILGVIGLISGYLLDKFISPGVFSKEFKENDLPVHNHDNCNKQNHSEFKYNLLHPSSKRIAVVVLLAVLITLFLLFSNIHEGWKIPTIIGLSIIGFIIILSVPRHFITEHIWEHIIKVHIPKIFIWTFASLIVVSVILKYVDINAFVNENPLYFMLIAILIGVIPQSGPHLVFVNLFAQGAIPFSILLANSISQDGHGMLPLLGESKRAFLLIKGIKIIIALIFGYGVYYFGY